MIQINSHRFVKLKSKFTRYRNIMRKITISANKQYYNIYFNILKDTTYTIYQTVIYPGNSKSLILTINQSLATGIEQLETCNNSLRFI